MSWAISAGQTQVTFPLAPSNITDENPVVETDFQVDGQQSVVVSEGLDFPSLNTERILLCSRTKQSLSRFQLR